MKKVAIVGVEGSGKTVMLAGLGDLYSQADENGYFLAPRNFQTASYVAEKVARMRKGTWPTATAEDVMQGLDWTLRRRQGMGRRPTDVCEVSCLDFAGEVYRRAFGIRQGQMPPNVVDEVSSLKSYIRDADDLIVLINLRDIIVQGVHEPRVQEAMWITNEILSYALDVQDGRKTPRAAIVLSQADSYAETIRSCGGAKGVLARYLPHVANNYDWLDILALSAVDKTTLDDNGNVVPAPDFRSTQLRQLMEWVLGGLDNFDKSREGGKSKDGQSRSKPQKTTMRLKVKREDGRTSQPAPKAQVTGADAANSHLASPNTGLEDGKRALKIFLCIAGGILGVVLLGMGIRWLFECIKWLFEHWIISCIIIGAICSAFEKK